MENIEFSKELSSKLGDYSIEMDAIGLSPAKVYKLTNSNEILYLKYSSNIYQPTTYCVGRETEVIKWLNGKINVPNIVFNEKYNDSYFLIMTELRGLMLEECSLSPSSYIEYLVKALSEIQSINISQCLFESNLEFRLKELEYLLDKGLTDNDCNNWEDTTKFNGPEKLYIWLCENKPKEELVFSHGDFCGSNVFLNGNEIGYIDLGRAGKADKWYDIAFCVREIRHTFNDEKYVKEFFRLLGIKPDWDKINYFTLLDELF